MSTDKIIKNVIYDSISKIEKSFSIFSIATELINKKYEKKQKRNIWGNSKWKNISSMENDDVGKVGEEIIHNFCLLAGIDSDINGIKTKNLGEGDGKINSKTVEIKTARLGSNGTSFQHELGELPWKAEYMLFLDIAPENMYITIFKNFTSEFYKKSGSDSSHKCVPYFPSKSITWRKKKGSFKLDTTINLNKKNKYTLSLDNDTQDFTIFKTFVNSIIIH